MTREMLLFFRPRYAIGFRRKPRGAPDRPETRTVQQRDDCRVWGQSCKAIRCWRSSDGQHRIAACGRQTVARGQGKM